MIDCPRTLVTGGAGFIGSHLVETLLGDGHSVTVIDNFSTGRVGNLAHLLHHDDLTIHEMDIVDSESLHTLFEGVDWVFHLAALADIVPSIQKPVEYHKANVEGTLKVLEAARYARVKRCVYAASSSCYGIPDVYPTSETAQIRTEYPYALSKYMGEQLALHWAEVYGLPVVSLRLFNVYGPRARTSGVYGAVFGVFLAQKIANKAFTVVGDGSQTRDFTFVTDVVNAFRKSAESDVCGKVFNVGSGNTYSVNQLVRLLGGGDIVHIPTRPGEPKCTFADTTKIRRELRWHPQVSFEQGVQIMLDNIDYWREAPVWSPESISEATQDWFAYLGNTSR